MTVADDLSTLRDALDDYTAVLWCHGYVASDPTEPDETAYAALDRVETEIARLERERDEAQQDRNEYIDIAERESARAEAAEAEVERLRDGLREIAESTHDSRSVTGDQLDRAEQAIVTWVHEQVRPLSTGESRWAARDAGREALDALLEVARAAREVAAAEFVDPRIIWAEQEALRAALARLDGAR